MDVTIKSRTPNPSEPETIVTEPLIAVLGHPIAGNPSQFALERAFESLHRDWRVISFDVKPDDLPVALSGLHVLGINGILLGAELAAEAAQWFNGQSSRLDCFYRAGTNSNLSDLLASDVQSHWIAEQIEAYFEQLNTDLPLQVCLIGETSLEIEGLICKKRSDARIVRLSDESETFCADAIASSSVFLIGNQKAEANLLDWDDWLVSPESALVIDLTDDDDRLDQLSRSGRSTVTSQQCHAGVLSHCIETWLGERASTEVIQDAIEEYMAV